MTNKKTEETQLYRMVTLPSDEPVQYVGCYVLDWGKATLPSVGFVPVEEETLMGALDETERFE